MSRSSRIDQEARVASTNSVAPEYRISAKVVVPECFSKAPVPHRRPFIRADHETSHKFTLPQPRRPPPTSRTPRRHIRISEIELRRKSAHASTFRLCHLPFRARFRFGGMFGGDFVGPEFVFGGEVGGFDGLFVVGGRGDGGGGVG